MHFGIFGKSTWPDFQVQREQDRPFQKKKKKKISLEVCLTSRPSLKSSEAVKAVSDKGTTFNQLINGTNIPCQLPNSRSILYLDCYNYQDQRGKGIALGCLPAIKSSSLPTSVIHEMGDVAVM